MDKVWDKIVSAADNYNIIPIEEVFDGWHNGRYLRQCYYNLEEKYDCGGIEQNYMDKIYGVCKEVL